MRKQLVIARRFPAQRVAERIRIDRDQEQPGLPEKMFSRGFGDLGGGGEMNKPVAGVISAAAENALSLGLAPGRSGADFIDRAQSGVPCLSLSLLGDSRLFLKPA